MKSQRSQEIDEVFQSALDLPSEQRAAYLAQACGSDHDLRLEVESLISSYDRSGSFIERPSIEIDASIVAARLMCKVGGWIGH